MTEDPSRGELILYSTEDGREAIRLRVVDGTVWLAQAEIAVLFDTTKQNVSLHLKNVFDAGELPRAAVIKESLTTAADGKSYPTLFYNLDAILAVGYRVRGPRGSQFRRWATTVLREFLIKGFVLDDLRLKEPGGFDYFDELLRRIRSAPRRSASIRRSATSSKPAALTTGPPRPPRCSLLPFRTNWCSQSLARPLPN